MITENTKLYTEDGDFVGTVGQIRDGVAKMVGELIDDILADYPELRSVKYDEDGNTYS